jgi:D-psicose/D-tagatose/L-ribulose 3-epimerase
MLLGMNMLLWTSHVDDSHIGVLETLKQVGFDGVELPVFSGDPDDYRRIGRHLSDIGLRATAVGVLPDTSCDCTSPDPTIRRGALDHIKWAIDCVEAMGGEVLCGPLYQPLGVFTGSPATADEFGRVVEVHVEAAAYAAAKNIKLAIEPLNRFECYFLNTVKDATALVKAVNAPNYGILYDTFHLNIEEKNPVASIEPSLMQINHVHVSESDRGAPGTGHVPWAETLSVFKSHDYRGWYVIEAFGRAFAENAAATRVWREFSPIEEIYLSGHDLLRRTYGAV